MLDKEYLDLPVIMNNMTSIKQAAIEVYMELTGTTTTNKLLIDII